MRLWVDLGLEVFSIGLEGNDEGFWRLGWMFQRLCDDRRAVESERLYDTSWCKTVTTNRSRDRPASFHARVNTPHSPLLDVICSVRSDQALSGNEPGGRMVTTDEIRKRVEAADQARIKSRADAAEAIATAVERRTALRAELAELDASITAQVRESAAVITIDELAEFTGIPIAELGAQTRAGRGRKNARSTSPRGRLPRTSGRARTSETSTSAPAAAGDDASASA